MLSQPGAVLDIPLMHSLRTSGFAPGARSDNRILAYLDSYPQPKKDFTAQLRALQEHYTILDDDRTVRELLETEPALYSLLKEAIKPLRHAFGDKWIIHVRVLSSNEDTILKVAVQLPADFGGDPERALRAFEEEWWLNNRHRSGGALIFDYEMRDAFRMEPTPFELTPAQKGILATLSRETGKSIPVLLAEALEVLQEHERLHHQHDNVPGTSPPATRSPSVLEIFREAREGIPEEVWKALPEDLAAQHDHYIYGTPKRSL